MRALAAICIRRPVFAAMLILALVVVGAASFFRLGVDRFPAVDLPNVMVRTTLPGASVEEVETQVSDILEEAVNRVEGINELRSVSAPGQSMVNVTFNLNRDIDTAAQDVRDRVGSVLRQLPRRRRPAARSSSRTATTRRSLSIALVRQPVDPRADRDRRQGRQGPARTLGGRRRGADRRRARARHQHLDRGRSSRGLPAADHRGARRAAAAERRSSRRQRHDRRSTSARCARSGRFTDAEQFNDLVIATRNGAPIRVRDIGHAEDGTKEQRSFARLNGVPTVVLDVRRQSGANTVAVIEAAKASLERVKPQLPAGVTLEIVRDQSTLHLRGAPRDQPAPRAGQHPRLPRGVRLHAQLAGDGDCRRRDPDVGRSRRSG